MAETVNFDLSEPRLQAVASPAPQNFDNFEPPTGLDSYNCNNEPLITPEGYDVNNYHQARAYLLEVHGDFLKETYGFEGLPEPKGELDASTDYHIAYRMMSMHRAARHENGKMQTNADHSYAVSKIAVRVAFRERPDLDTGKVSIMANIHDELETYGGDTPIFNRKLLADKPFREGASKTIQAKDLQEVPELAAIYRELDEAKTLEAKFVKAMDKVEALLFALHTKSNFQREDEPEPDDYIELVEVMLAKTSIDKTAFLYAKSALKEIGRKWISWGCKPFKGDPAEIIEAFASQYDPHQPDPGQPHAAPLPEGIVDLAAERAKRRKPRPEPPFRPVGSLALAG